MNKDQIVECVPNFSEGKNQDNIQAIADAIRKHDGVCLTDIDSGESTNRTVYTIIGTPSCVIDSIISAAKVAYELIDMANHKGEHKRLGALDVCPFIPIKNLTLNDCSLLAKECAKKLSETLNIPTYLYGYASEHSYRMTVPQIRQGEYEGLKDKLNDLAWRPDFGPTKFVTNWGATMVGARKVLIAYNINLIATKEQANKIAFDIRELGRGPDQPGCFKAIQAMGWLLKEKNLAQLTINLIDYEITSLYDVWEEVNKRAKDNSIPVCGSEIVGVVPLKAILDVAEFYIKKENLIILEEDLKIQYVVSKLGLNFLNNFDIRKKIIEYIIEDEIKSSPSYQKKLIELNVTDFINEVRNREVVPGGGSVSALCASLATSLLTMVGRISSGRKKFEHNDELMKKVLPIFYDYSDKFLSLVDLDSEAYQMIVDSNRLPETNDDEKNIKALEQRNATMNAITVPQTLMKEISLIWKFVEEICPVINMNAISDIQVAISCLKTATYGAYYNVCINLENLTWNTSLKEKIIDDVKQKLSIADIYSEKLLNLLKNE